MWVFSQLFYYQNPFHREGEREREREIPKYLNHRVTNSEPFYITAMAVSRRGIWSGLRREWWVRSMTAMWPATRRGQSVGTVEGGGGREEDRSEQGEIWTGYRESCVHEQVWRGGNLGTYRTDLFTPASVLCGLVASLLHVCCSGFSGLTCFSSFFNMRRHVPNECMEQ